MAQVTEHCERCGADSTFNIPDDHDGTSIVWECPGVLDDGRVCGNRGVIAGDDPAIAAVALAATNEPDVLDITDGDIGTAGDLHV